MIENDFVRHRQKPSRIWIPAGLAWSIALGAWADERVFINPYENVDWGAIKNYYGNFHTHTTCSDGDYSPHEVIDMYKKLGYHILALTDHDTDHPIAGDDGILYPWTNLAGLYDQIKDKPNTSWRWNQAPFGMISEPWENRDPDALHMISVPGAEISRAHHIGSLFCTYPGHTSSEETALTEIGKRNGLAVFYHPGRYDLYPAWYAYFYRRHDHLIGMEVYNQENRTPHDRNMWDRVLHQLMPDRPVWGLANDDMHQTDHLGWNFTVLPLETLDKGDARAALESGAFYFYKPAKRGTPPDFHIAGIGGAVDRLQIAVNREVRLIEWITYDQESKHSRVIHAGAELTLADVPDTARFVRARIVGESGTAYTQPFGIQRARAETSPDSDRNQIADAADWSTFRDEGSIVSVDTANETLKASYNLNEGHWVSIVKPVGDVSETSIIRFDIRGEGNRNTVEIKLEDRGGATYGRNLPMKSDDGHWSTVEISVSDLKYWWGGEEALDGTDARLSFAIVKKGDDQGGTGTVYLDNIRIQ